MDRPLGIAVISVLEAILSLFLLLLGLYIGLHSLLAILFVVLGLIGFALAVGLYVGNEIAYVVTIFFEIIGVLMGLSNISANWLSLIIGIIIIAYLALPETRDFFF